ncbi:MAG: SDR family oxidoreductase [Acidobacteriota bacterium]
MSSPVLLITGGGRGIGAATVRLAAQRGFDVCLSWCNDEASAQAVADEVTATGRRVLLVRADIGREEDVLSLFARCDRELGTLTALVNNAGILEAQGRVEDVTAERLSRIFAVNVTGAFLCAREAIRRMSTARGGTGGAIVNVSSMAARLGSAGEYVDYAASKGAVDTMTVGLAREVATEGIRVNAVRPGLIHTEIHASGGEPNRVERLRNLVPMKRGGEAGEVAHAILWLLSEKASFTTGALLDVAGGL